MCCTAFHGRAGWNGSPAAGRRATASKFPSGTKLAPEPYRRRRPYSGLRRHRASTPTGAHPTPRSRVATVEALSGPDLAPRRSGAEVRYIGPRSGRTGQRVDQPRPPPPVMTRRPVRRIRAHPRAGGRRPGFGHADLHRAGRRRRLRFGRRNPQPAELRIEVSSGGLVALVEPGQGDEDLESVQLLEYPADEIRRQQNTHRVERLRTATGHDDADPHAGTPSTAHRHLVPCPCINEPHGFLGSTRPHTSRSRQTWTAPRGRLGLPPPGR